LETAKSLVRKPVMMTPKKSKLRIIIATLGLETHWRGAAVVVGMLRDLGMEVVYFRNAYPLELIEMAVQEDVDIVGVSILTGAHLALGGELIQKAREKGIKDDVVFIIGGVFPPNDIPRLRQIGFDGVFEPGVTKDEINSFIKKTVAAR
jgi:methylmalonyl-CoA mutase, C-terminal domain